MNQEDVVCADAVAGGPLIVCRELGQCRLSTRSELLGHLGDVMKYMISG